MFSEGVNCIGGQYPLHSKSFKLLLLILYSLKATFKTPYHVIKVHVSLFKLSCQTNGFHLNLVEIANWRLPRDDDAYISNFFQFDG